MFTDWPEELKDLWKCKWSQFLDHSIVHTVLRSNFDEISLASFDNVILLSLGIASLQAFVQDNFLGPPLLTDTNFQLLAYHKLVNETSTRYIKDYLLSGGEEININVTHPELLALAKFIFINLNDRTENSDFHFEMFICRSWYLRYCYIHQLVIDENTDELFEKGLKVSNEISNIFNVLDADVETKGNAFLEITQYLLHYKRIQLADDKLRSTNETINVSLTVQGKLGVRTKYQQKALPQLILKAECNETTLTPSSVTHQCDIAEKLPKLLQLDDDVRLEKIRFVNEDDNEVLRLPSVIQALALTTL